MSQPPVSHQPALLPQPSPFWPGSRTQGKGLPVEETGVDPKAGLQVIVDDVGKLNKPR